MHDQLAGVTQGDIYGVNVSDWLGFGDEGELVDLLADLGWEVKESERLRVLPRAAEVRGAHRDGAEQTVSLKKSW